MTAIRVLVVDDHTIFRETMCGMLERDPGIEVVGEAEDGRAAVELVRELAPDVVVMDLVMRSLNGIDASRMILRERPAVKVIILSMHGDPRLVREVLAAGAAAYLLKECAYTELVQAIRSAARGDQTYLSPAITRVVLDDYLKPARGDGPARLTPREREILQMVAEGRTSREIADTLSVSVRTVENHRARIMHKLGAGSVADLVKFAIREGLTPP